MSFWQRLFAKVTPGLIADMEAHSRLWMVQCPNCGFEKSIWEMGGIRYKAYSRGKKIYQRCIQCDKRGWHKVYKREPQPEDQKAGGV